MPGLESAATYGLKFQSRAIAAELANKSRLRWFVGTNALRESNEVQAIDYDPDTESLSCTAMYPHQSEVWHIAPSPFNSSHLFTIYNSGATYHAKLWSTADDDSQLTELAELGGHVGVIHTILWNAEDEHTVVSMDEGHVRMWNLREAGVECVGSAAGGDMQQMMAGCWDPHSAHRMATTAGHDVQVWDVRSMRKKFEIEGAHAMPIRSCDFARHTEHLLATGADDCKLRCWDLRAGSKGRPLLDISAHAHWLWSVQFNHFYDQLLLSCSSDATVSLWYMAGMGDNEDSPNKTNSPTHLPRNFLPGHSNCKADVYDEHEDSVYGVCWTPCDPWVFASLSYDGRMMVNKVPSQTKYKIII